MPVLREFDHDMIQAYLKSQLHFLLDEEHDFTLPYCQLTPTDGAFQQCGIGLAIVEIGRLARIRLRRPSALARWFTPEELARAENRPLPQETLAGAYACKLATNRALQSVLPSARSLRPADIRISHSPAGQPQAALTDRATARLGLPDSGYALIMVSITHSRAQAAAVALAQAISGSRAELQAPDDRSLAR